MANRRTEDKRFLNAVSWAKEPGGREAWLRLDNAGRNSYRREENKKEIDENPVTRQGGSTDMAKVSALQQLYARQRAEVQNGLDRAMDALYRSKQEEETRLKNNLDNLLADLQARRQQADQTVEQQYEKNSGELNASADRSLAEAYASKMAAQRNMSQLLSAQGLTGGMSESTLMGLNNHYGKSRNNLEVGRQSGTAALLSQMQQQKAANQNSYLTSASTARQNYQAQYEQLRRQMLAQQAAQQKDYNQLLQSVLKKEPADLF